MRRFVVGFGRFWYDFVVGDDWTIALGVVIAIALTRVLVHHHHVNAWYLLPVAVGVGLSASVLRAARR
ncbi:MAG: hypothetical protein JF603_15305 [Acidobacteria bacterium]|nr:hypothetical protein [Acidobacteriota bacterium]